MQPGTQRPYEPNPWLSNRNLAEINNPNALVMFYESDSTGGERYVAFADGHVDPVSDDKWPELRRASGIDQSSAQAPPRSQSVSVISTKKTDSDAYRATCSYLARELREHDIKSFTFPASQDRRAHIMSSSPNQWSIQSSVFYWDDEHNTDGEIEWQAEVMFHPADNKWSGGINYYKLGGMHHHLTSTGWRVE